MYVRRALQESLTPPIYGWNNVRCPDFVAQEHIVLQAGARNTRRELSICWGCWG